MKQVLTLCLMFLPCFLLAQNNSGINRMTPELLWKLGRVSGLGISKDGNYVVYTVSTPNATENKSSRKSYAIPVTGGDAILLSNPDSMLNNDKISPDGKYMISSNEVKIKRLPEKIIILNYQNQMCTFLIILTIAIGMNMRMGNLGIFFWHP